MSTIKPGRETDAAVARALGWRLARPCYGFPPNCEGMKHPVVYPRPSTVEADALAALEAVGQGYFIVKTAHGYAVGFVNGNPDGKNYPTLCLAASAAILVWAEAKGSSK